MHLLITGSRLSSLSVHSVTHRTRVALGLAMRASNGVKKKAHLRNVHELQPEYQVVEDEHLGGRAVRFVKPYVQEFKTFAKGRWLGRQVMEVMSTEFGGHPPDYWPFAFERGLVRVNDQVIDPAHRFKNGDVMTHLTDRHEPPVFGKVRLVAETDSVVAVSKPPSLPMHACGAYRFNSLEYILKYEPVVPSQPPLSLVHRLDRVTSGLVILAKGKETANRLSEQIRSKNTSKIYLARVQGRFPAALDRFRALPAMNLSLLDNGDGQDGLEDEGGAVAQPTVASVTGKRPRDASAETSPVNSKEDCSESVAIGSGPLRGSALPVGYIKAAPTVAEVAASSRVGYWTCPAPPTAAVAAGFNPSTGLPASSPLPAPATARQAGGEMLYVLCPVTVLSYRDGVHACDPDGKPSLSLFRCLGYDADSDTSLVECRPYTGRTHQLRLHLQLLGNPIANDPCYGGALFYHDEGRRRQAARVLARMKKEGLTPLSRAYHALSDSDLQALTSSEGEEEGEKIDLWPFPESVKEEDGEDKERRLPREGESQEDFVRRTCRLCSSKTARLPETAEYLLHCDGIWLHALQYSGEDWAFQAEIPAWARPFLQEQLGSGDETERPRL